MGHKIIRLSPFPFLIQSYQNHMDASKCEVATKNTTFKIKNIRKLLEEAVSHESMYDWKKCFEHAERLREKDIIKECVCDETTQNFDFNLQDNSVSK
ncbi:hypothetical protein NPIL_608231 [Nephila pilipes]|uniref:Uncharacterized protein n=1 Tax=Nephila pilipes TaxID=299642 RepID=A0A8X6PL11_NEPPI|nr:hypothetical protein NPIL_608231 [Nephila pilipes]